NLAARLCSRAKAGEILASEAVSHLARTISGSRYVALEPIQVKGLSESVRPVRVVPDGEDPVRQMAGLLAATKPGTASGPRVRWLPGPLAAHPRLTAAGVVVAVLVVAGGVVVAVSGGGSKKALSAFGENSVGIVDGRKGTLIAQAGVDNGPSAAASGFGSVWTANTTGNTVSRIDTSTHQVIRTINVGEAPSAIAVGPDAVWTANGSAGTVSRIDPTTNQVQTVPVGASPGGVVVAAGSVWVTNTADGTVSRIDPALNKVVQTIQVGASPSGIAAGRDIWVANSASNTVTKIDSSSHAIAQTIHVGNDPRGIVASGDSVWVTNNLDGTVARIATDGTSVTDTARVGAEPTGIAEVSGRLWVATQAKQALAEIDPSSARVVRMVPVGATPTGLVSAGGRLWVTTTIDPGLHRGGTLRLSGSLSGSVDPVYFSDFGMLWLLNGSYDGLVQFRHAAGAEGTAIVPDLASAIPEPSNGGRTYSFRLRPGIRWSDGRLLTASDVKHGIERSLASGFSTLQGKIAGTGGCTPKRCSVSAIKADDAAQSVVITLEHADARFLGELAGGGVAAPVATPLTEEKTRPIPATGPYQIAEFVPGKRVVLTRNPYFREWSPAAQPDGFADRIEWVADVGAGEARNGTQAIESVAAGKSDWTDARGSDPVAKLQARFGGRVFVTPTETTQGVVLNTRVPPFNDVRVRRAVAYAVDRAAAVADWPSNAAITCQTLPPDFPGHRPYCPYTLRPDSSGGWNAPDFARAQQLVSQSHTRGMTVTVYSLPIPAAGVKHVVDALNQLGYHAKLTQYPSVDSYFQYVANSSHRVQAAFFGWVANNVNAGDFFNSLFRCSSFTPNSDDNQNAAQFCDPSVDRLMDRAAALDASGEGDDVWAQVDWRVTDQVGWLPLANPTWVDVVSSRLHNYVRSPVLGTLFSQMWVR
ncbi:MAG TPA: ABC transporter substrate-binding protein, partial [Jatrophihabitantaceae bacterium]|nr:ABC transporter substrate-binding protein [Jatrophihabitantaceae bacterium]